MKYGHYNPELRSYGQLLSQFYKKLDVSFKLPFYNSGLSFVWGTKEILILLLFLLCLQVFALVEGHFCVNILILDLIIYYIIFSDIGIYIYNTTRLKSENLSFINRLVSIFYGVLPERRDKHLEIKFYDGNQADDKIAWGLGRGFLCIHSSFG